MCKNGSWTALQLFATDSLHSFLFLSLFSRQKNPEGEPQARFPPVCFTLPSIKALCPIKVDALCHSPVLSEGVLREEHSGQVFLLVWKEQRKFVCASTVHYSC